MAKPIFKSTHYELNKFIYAFKLNQLVKAACLTRDECYYKERFYRKRLLEKHDKTQPITDTLKPEIKKYHNRPCYPCKAFIRRWKVWLRFTHRAWFFSSACFYCTFFIEKKQRGSNRSAL